MQTKSHLNNSQIEALNTALVDKIPEIFDHYGIIYKQNSRTIKSSCPVHEGDNTTAFQVYISGHTYCGNWYCRTHNCHKEYTGTPLGLLRGLITRFENNGEKVTFGHTLERAKQLTQINLSGIRCNNEEVSKSLFIRQAKIHMVDSTIPSTGISRELVRSSLEIPSKYFIKRGFDAEILDKYDIGDCVSTDIKKEMFGRAVVPVYNEKHTELIGCSGRSRFDKCDTCKCFHSGNCPKEEFKWQFSKWRHSKSLKAEKSLFNFWYAKPIISSAGTAILVESPGNILKLEQAGIHIGLATFGDHITDFQKALVNSTGCLNLVIIGDNDVAGKKYNKIVPELCRREYNCYTIDISGQDLAEMSTDDIQKEICPLLQKLKAI